MSASLTLNDRRRGPVVTEVSSARESERQFLDRTGANTKIKDVLTKLVENRPQDPIAFIADYFESLDDKVNYLNKAHQQICLTHHTKPAFNGNVRIAYDKLCQAQLNTMQAKALTGGVFMDLILYLCKDFPPLVTDKLCKKVSFREYEVIVFEVFRSTIFTCMVLQDFLKQAENLYRFLDSEGTEKVDRVLCETLNQQLLQAVIQSDGMPKSVLEAGYILGPDKLYEALASALFKDRKSKQTMTCEEFISQTANAFLVKVTVIR